MNYCFVFVHKAHKYCQSIFVHWWHVNKTITSTECCSCHFFASNDSSMDLGSKHLHKYCLFLLESGWKCHSVQLCISLNKPWKILCFNACIMTASWSISQILRIWLKCKVCYTLNWVGSGVIFYPHFTIAVANLDFKKSITCFSDQVA